MPRNHRLTGQALKELKGVRLHGTFFSLLAAPISGTHSQCACVVSKKIAPHAAKRNLIKRRCRSALSKVIPLMHESRALVFYAKKPAQGASFSDIEVDIKALVARLGRTRS
jgi:ribonuclease P protein component